MSRSLDCAICIKLLYDPVTLPCGHNFCMVCVDQLKDHVCPLCRADFSKTKQFGVNRLIKEVLQSKRFRNEYEERRVEMERYILVSKKKIEYIRSKRFMSLIDQINNYLKKRKKAYITIEDLIDHLKLYPGNDLLNNFEDEIMAIMNYTVNTFVYGNIIFYTNVDSNYITDMLILLISRSNNMNDNLIYEWIARTIPEYKKISSESSYDRFIEANTDVEFLPRHKNDSK